MTLREFEIFVLGIDEDSRKIVGQIYEEALRTDFGFGDVRIERLNNSAQKVYERLINEAEQEVNQEWEKHLLYEVLFIEIYNPIVWEGQ